MKNQIKILSLVLLITLALSFVSAYESNWNDFNNRAGACINDNGDCVDTACHIQGGYCGCSASGYGLDWIQLYPSGGCVNQNGYRFLGFSDGVSGSSSCIIASGIGMGKLFVIPSSGAYYVSVSAGWGIENNENLYLGVNDWGNNANRRLVYDFAANTQCIFKNKFNLDSTSAKIWVEASSSSNSVHVKQFKVSDCIPASVTNYCDDGTVIPADVLRCGQTITCTHDSDCGSNIFNNFFCNGNDLFQNLSLPVCLNPGTVISSCSVRLDSSLNKTCSFGCSNGACNPAPGTLPTINVTSPINGSSYTNASNPVLNATSDQFVNWTYNLNGNSVNAGNGFSITLPLNPAYLVNGSNILVVFASNINGTVNKTIIFNYNSTVIPPTSLPTITIVSPNQLQYNTTNILVNLSSTNAVVVKFKINGTNWSYNGLAWNNYYGPKVIDVLTSGTYTIWAFSADGHGNLASANFTFSVNTSFIDTTPPVITVYSPQGTIRSHNVLINFSATDISGISSKWYFNRTSNRTYSASEYITLPDGVYTFTFYANDTYNNLASKVVTFKVDTTTDDDDGKDSSDDDLILRFGSENLTRSISNSNFTTETINLTSSKSSFNLQLLWYWLLLLILILLIIIILVLILGQMKR